MLKKFFISVNGEYIISVTERFYCYAIKLIWIYHDLDREGIILHRQAKELSDAEIERLEDILMQIILLEEKRWCTAFRRKKEMEICRRLDQLMLERDRLMYGDK